MINKSKLNRLKLTVSKRENKQIANFFSLPNTSDKIEETNSVNDKNILETKAKCIIKDTETILILTDDEDNDNNIEKLGCSSKNQLSENKFEDSISIRKTVVSKFFNESLDDFEEPVMKTTTNKSLKTKLKTTKNNGNRKRKKKQTSIKSAFTKNEEIFNELMAQHSIAENFNPEEMQLALACSLSETLNKSFNINAEQKESVNCISDNSSKIREKLSQYGFRINSNNEDYDIKYFLPKGKNKAKWANKYTPLTFRCPEKQKKKLNDKIEKLLNSQFDETENLDEMPFEFKISSTYLKTLIPEIDTIKYFRKCLYMGNENDNIEIFYVTDLFEPSKSKPGSLLKNFKDIPGRDLSPTKISIIKNIEFNEEISNNEDDIEEADSDMQFSKKKNCILKSSKSKINDTKIENNYEPGNINICLGSPDCKRIKIDSILLENEACCKDRAESPDLFALSDQDLSFSDEVSESILETSIVIQKDNIKEINKSKKLSSPPNSYFESEQIMCYEKFSSDEVKVSDNIKMFKINSSPEKDKVVDLTQNYDSILDKGIEDKTDVENSYIILSDDEENILTNSTEETNTRKKDQQIDIAPIETYIKHTTASTTNQSDINFYCDFSKESILENSTKDSNNLILKDLYPLSQQSNSNDSCITLSDDEVNYSIINSSKRNFKSSKKETDKICNKNKTYETDIDMDEILINETSNKNISLVDFIGTEDLHKKISNQKYDLTKESNLKILEDNLSDASDLEIQLTPKKYLCSFETDNFNDSHFKSPSPVKQKKYSISPYKTTNESNFTTHITDETFDLNILRREYGISSSQKNINNKKYSNCKKSLSESFLKLKTNDSCFQKFSSFTKSNKLSEKCEPKTSTIDYTQILKLDEYDEFDKMVYGSPIKYAVINNDTPNDFEKLLTANINEFSPIKSQQKTEPFEFENDGKIYIIRTKNIEEKPDYNGMDYSILLQKLYNFGLKPLKRKQAINMLEYIYNQTHPVVLEKSNSSTEIERNKELSVENMSIHFSDDYSDKRDDIHYEITECQTVLKFNKLNLKDYFWEELCNYEKNNFECINETYIFQTNTSKKISTALLPLHLAWSNLVKSNTQLRESILHFEPIDLQEIYIFFKSIGYRYDPKDIKNFFDKKCIIFRYDLGSNNNRHLKKKDHGLRKK